MPRFNPFEQAPAEVNFPPFSHLFECSPSIDTIARTKPAEFSLERSFASRAASERQSPLVSSIRSGDGQRARSPRNRPRVAKQLNFSLPSAPREKGVSRAAATAAGWPTPGGGIGRSCQSAPGAVRSAQFADAGPATAHVAPGKLPEASSAAASSFTSSSSSAHTGTGERTEPMSLAERAALGSPIAPCALREADTCAMSAMHGGQPASSAEAAEGLKWARWR